MSGVVENYGILKEATILLAVAGIIVPLLHKLKINSILGFLLLGMLLGPFGLGALEKTFPQLDMIVVHRSEGLSLLGDMGVVFLLFLIGIELSIQRLVRMRKLVFGLGGLQVLLCVSAFFGIGLGLGISPTAAVVMGMAFALSSTAIVIQCLSKKKQMNTATGKASFAILLFQDLAVIPMLFFLNLFEHGTGDNVFAAFALAMGQAVIVVGAIYIAGRFLVRPIFQLVASTDSPDLFVATTLLVAMGTAEISSMAGLSMSLGAFIAGLLIAETEYSHSVRLVIEPFKGLLLGLFFFTVGMGIDVNFIVNNPLLIMGFVVTLILAKIIIILPLVRLFGFEWKDSVKTAMYLGSAGEFAFVIIAMAVGSKIFTPEESALAISVGSITMSMIPFMGTVGDFLASKMKKEDAIKKIVPEPEDTEKVEALVIGLGGFGNIVKEFFVKYEVPFIGIDIKPEVISEMRSKGIKAFYGNGVDAEFLEMCGIEKVKSVIITSDQGAQVEEMVKSIRGIRSDLHILAVARNTEAARKLYKVGASRVVTEITESSLQLLEAALVSVGKDIEFVSAIVNNKRQELMLQLKDAM